MGNPPVFPLDSNGLGKAYSNSEWRARLRREDGFHRTCAVACQWPLPGGGFATRLMSHSHGRSLMIIALASPRVAASLDDGLERIKRLLSDAAAQGAEIACFPEAYLPGLRGQDFDVWIFDQA